MRIANTNQMMTPVRALAPDARLGHINVTSSGNTGNPKLDYMLSCVAPHQFTAAPIENGYPMDAAIQPAAGSYTYTPTTFVNTDVNNWTVVWLCPLMQEQYNGTGAIGFTYYNTANPSITVAQAAEGISKTDMWGVTTYADRFRIVSIACQIEVAVPAANVSGVAYVGTIPVGMISGGLSMTSLIARSTQTIDLKSGIPIMLRSSVNTVQALHDDRIAVTSFTGVHEERASYAVFKNVAFSVADGKPAIYSLVTKYNANVLMATDGDQPAMAGISNALTMRTNVSTRAHTEVDEANCQALRKLTLQPTPPSNWDLIVSKVKAGISIVGDVVEAATAVYNTVAPAISYLGGLLADEHLTLPSPAVKDDIAVLNWESRPESKFSFEQWPSEALDLYDDYTAARDDLISTLDSYSKTVEEWRKARDSGTVEYRNVRGKKTAHYLDARGKEVLWDDFLRKWKEEHHIPSPDTSEGEEMADDIPPEPPQNRPPEFSLKTQSRTSRSTSKEESKSSFKKVR